MLLGPREIRKGAGSFDGGKAHVVEAGFDVVNGPGARLRLICQISQDETLVQPHLTSQFILCPNPWLLCDKLTNLVAQASESPAKAAFHRVLNTQCQHCQDFRHWISSASDKFGSCCEVVVKLQPFVIVLVEHLGVQLSLS